MNVNPVSPVHWAGSEPHSAQAKAKFTTDETVKAAETERPVDAATNVKAAQPEEPETARAAPPSALQLKIQEMLNEQADKLQQETTVSGG